PGVAARGTHRDGAWGQAVARGHPEAAAVARAGRRGVDGAVGDRPLDARGDEHRGVVDPPAAVDPAAAVGAAAAVDLVAVVLVVSHPIDVVHRAVELFHGVVVVVPELLEALLLGGEALVALGEDVPPRLIAAVAQRAPAGGGLPGAQGQPEHGAGNHGD